MLWHGAKMQFLVYCTGKHPLHARRPAPAPPGPRSAHVAADAHRLAVGHFDRLCRSGAHDALLLGGAVPPGAVGAGAARRALRRGGGQPGADAAGVPRAGVLCRAALRRAGSAADGRGRSFGGTGVRGAALRRVLPHRSGIPRACRTGPRAGGSGGVAVGPDGPPPAAARGDGARLGVAGRAGAGAPRGPHHRRAGVALYDARRARPAAGRRPVAGIHGPPGVPLAGRRECQPDSLLRGARRFLHPHAQRQRRPALPRHADDRGRDRPPGERARARHAGGLPAAAGARLGHAAGGGAQGRALRRAPPGADARLHRHVAPAAGRHPRPGARPAGYRSAAPPHGPRPSPGSRPLAHAPQRADGGRSGRAGARAGGSLLALAAALRASGGGDRRADRRAAPPVHAGPRHPHAHRLRHRDGGSRREDHGHEPRRPRDGGGRRAFPAQAGRHLRLPALHPGRPGDRGQTSRPAEPGGGQDGSVRARRTRHAPAQRRIAAAGCLRCEPPPAGAARLRRALRLPGRVGGAVAGGAQVGVRHAGQPPIAYAALLPALVRGTAGGGYGHADRRTARVPGRDAARHRPDARTPHHAPSCGAVRGQRRAAQLPRYGCLRPGAGGVRRGAGSGAGGAGDLCSGAPPAARAFADRSRAPQSHSAEPAEQCREVRGAGQRAAGDRHAGGPPGRRAALRR